MPSPRSVHVPLDPPDDAAPRDPAWAFALAPLAAFAVAVPFVVRRIRIEIPAELASAYAASPEHRWLLTDVYCDYKALAVLGLGAVMLAALALRLTTAPRFPRGWGREAWPLAALAAITLASAFRSPYGFTAWWGAPLRREGAAVLLAYAAAAAYGRVFLRDARAFRVGFAGLAGAGVLMAAWGLTQAWWINPLNAAALQPMLAATPTINSARGIPALDPTLWPENAVAAARQPASFSEGTHVPIAGLFNVNYFGVYVAMALAVTLVGFGFMLWENAARPERGRAGHIRAALAAFAAVTLAVALLAAQNLSGCFGLALAAFATALLAWRPCAAVRRAYGRIWKPALGAVLLTATALVAATPVGRATAAHLHKSVRDALHPPVLAPRAELAGLLPRRLRLARNVVRVDTPAGAVTYAVAGVHPVQLVVRDANGVLLPVKWERRANRYNRIVGYLPQGAYPRADVSVENGGRRFTISFRDQHEVFQVDFEATPDGTVYYMPNPLSPMRSVTLPPPAWEPWTGFGRFATARGYFWSRAVPLLPDAGALGYGPDTVAHVFPHYDVPGRRKNWLDHYIFTKIQHWYLATWLGTGWLGLLALLAFLAAHFVRLGGALRAWWRRPPGDAPADGAVFAAATLAAWAGGWVYAGALCWTDSTIHYSPVFWALTGAGWAAAAQLRRLARAG